MCSAGHLSCCWPGCCSAQTGQRDLHVQRMIAWAVCSAAGRWPWQHLEHACTAHLACSSAAPRRLLGQVASSRMPSTEPRLAWLQCSCPPVGQLPCSMGWRMRRLRAAPAQQLRCPSQYSYILGTAGDSRQHSRRGYTLLVTECISHAPVLGLERCSSSVTAPAVMRAQPST